MARFIIRSFRMDARGASAVEFAFVLPGVLLLILAVYNLCFVAYAASNLHWAAEQAARCAAMSQQNTGVPCGTTRSTAQTYAVGLYKGPTITPSFTASEDTSNSQSPCRKLVGTGTYRIAAGYVNLSVPISATACYPEMNTGTAWS